jgi:DNA (cytosine-5)-methyltransferase 1
MVIRVGTDCSGIEAPIQALLQMKKKIKHVWSCDYDKFAKQSIYANYKPEIWYDNITTRDHTSLPDIDLYVCGFPCQPFSLMGNKQGTKDKR